MKEVETAAGGVDMNRRFHTLIASACGNDLLRRMTINLLDLSTPYLVWFRESTNREFERQADEHEDILRACEQQDPEGQHSGPACVTFPVFTWRKRPGNGSESRSAGCRST